jgi:hypothetical protein
MIVFFVLGSIVSALSPHRTTAVKKEAKKEVESE